MIERTRVSRFRRILLVIAAGDHRRNGVGIDREHHEDVNHAQDHDDEHRKEMRVGVALAVTEVDIRNQRAQRFRQIRGHIGIGILVHRDRARRVRRDDRADTVTVSQLAERALHLVRDDEDLLACGRRDGESFLPHKRILQSSVWRPALRPAGEPAPTLNVYAATALRCCSSASMGIRIA